MAIVSKAKKQPAHIRKLSGGHHRKSKSYSKPYWPYLPMLAVIGLGLLVNTLWANTGHILGVHSDLSATTLLATTNAARTSDHEPSLTFNSQLMQAAQTKAADMVAQNYWSHDTPEGKTPWTFITAAGYDYQLAGENLAYGFSDGSSLISAWMSSPEHRANILNTDFQNVGFGIASSPDYQNKGPEIIVVALYAEPVVSAVSISFTVPSSSATSPQSTANVFDTRLVSRLALLPGGSSEWALLVVALMTGAAITLFVIRNGLRLHNALVKGEAFVVHHPLFDIAIVLIITAGLVVTRSVGVIG